jgi:superfamily II DNA or RNA helicase
MCQNSGWLGEMLHEFFRRKRDKLESMLLLTGPAGSGKTSRILERVRDALRRRDSGVRLLTPTATMAQHLQNQWRARGSSSGPH